VALILTSERTYGDRDRVLTAFDEWYGTDRSLTTYAYVDGCP
jgi:hypothetical protein